MKISIIFIFIITSFFSIPLLNIKGSAHFFYREITYKNIANYLTTDNKMETFFNVFDYVYKDIDGVADNIKLPVLDENSFVDAIRGYGYCDQQAFFFMNILNKIGFKSRLRDVQAHTYSEVFINNQWIISDPFYGIIFFNENNEILTIDQIKNKNSIRDYYDFTNLNIEKYSLKKFQKIYKPNNIRWENGTSPNFIQYRSYSFLRKFMEQYSNILFIIFGEYYYSLYQDLYLKIYSEKSLVNPYVKWKFSKSNLILDNKKEYKSFKNFFMARNYHLATRYKKAEKFYEQSIINSPNSFWANESNYYLGKLYYKLKKYEQSIEFLNKLNQNYPRYSKVNFYLGLNYLNLGNKLKAKFYLNKSSYLYSKITLREIL